MMGGTADYSFPIRAVREEARPDPAERCIRGGPARTTPFPIIRSRCYLFDRFSLWLYATEAGAAAK
jgi:hypothetical protein